jgi:3'-phosphoadenosine 5'-phosphosulfate synthase
MMFFDPANAGDFENISGTKMRTMAKAGQLPPDGYMCPTGWEVLAKYYKALA